MCIYVTYVGIHINIYAYVYKVHIYYNTCVYKNKNMCVCMRQAHSYLCIGVYMYI